MNNDYQFLTPAESEHPYTISEINSGVANIIESGNTLVWVEGEISNWKKASSGHVYFRLKDQNSQIPSVIWRSSVSDLRFEPQDGMAVIAIASIRVYQRGGYYQLDVHRMQPLGTGALQIAFEQLKAKLEKEGLFDPVHKRPLPQSINTIGVVTSKNGAAIHDIIKVISSRAPQTDIVLVDVAVQGDKAPSEIAQAIRLLNDYGKIDCIIVGRGGGSIEDLWAFNEEEVARAVFESEIALISAVGHEVDFTITDFVADVRAPTPSAAAETAVADSKESKRFFNICSQRFASALEKYFSRTNYHYQNTIRRSALRKPLRMLREAQQERDSLEERTLRNMEIIMRQFSSRLGVAAARIETLSPLSTLARGYSIVTKNNGIPVRSSSQLTPGEKLDMKFLQGGASARVVSIDDSSESEIAF
jgi:exodeoxyribonuclease VII large subunit